MNVLLIVYCVLLGTEMGVKFSEWEAQVPGMIRDDVLWKMKVYRQSLFLSDICWNDVSLLVKDPRTKSLSNQLYRSAGSIAANIEEGYSKLSGKDRARFYEYALGSARESRGWYYRGRHVLGGKVFDHRAWLLTEIIKMRSPSFPKSAKSGFMRVRPNIRWAVAWMKRFH